MSTAPGDHPVIHAATVEMVVAEPGTRLQELHAAYADAKAEADYANDRLKTITDGIKAELAAASPEARRLELRSPGGRALRMTYTESWRVDTKRLKAENPAVYVEYATKSGSWRLAPAPAEEA